MSNVEFRYDLKGRDKVVIQMRVQGGATTQMELNAAQVSVVIRGLANLRSRMSEDVPSEIPENQPIEAVLNPSWRTGVHEQGLALALRDPGHGWLSFLLPPEEAAGLGRFLIDNTTPQA